MPDPVWIMTVVVGVRAPTADLAHSAALDPDDPNGIDAVLYWSAPHHEQMLANPDFDTTVAYRGEPLTPTTGDY